MQYVYDAWGNHECRILTSFGTFEQIDPTKEYTTSEQNYILIANTNPFRYRGYYYDVETGLYYLNSRYYDPELGRFINADDISYLAPDIINGLNLYSYCNNNPVMNSDTTGTAWWHWLVGALFIALLAVAVVISAGGVLAGIGAVASVIAGGSAATLGTTIAAGVFIGASTTYIAMGISAGINSIGILSNGGSLNFALNNFADFGESALISTVTSGVLGGIFGALAYKEQHPKITHSWTTERQNYWKSHGSLDGTALLGGDGYKQVLHHPFGRHGAGFYNYIPLERNTHIQLHKMIGYKNFALPFPYTNYWELILRFFGG